MAFIACNVDVIIIFQSEIAITVFPRNLTAVRFYFKTPVDAAKYAVTFRGQQDIKEMRYLNIIRVVLLNCYEDIQIHV